MALKNKRGRTKRASSGKPGKQNAEAAKPPFLVLVISGEDKLQTMVDAALHEGWSSLRARDSSDAQDALTTPHVRVIVLDDEVVEAEDREWLMTRVHRDAPFASVIYVAGAHSEQTERQARAHGAKYYTAAPLVADSFVEVVRGFMRIHGDPGSMLAAGGINRQRKAGPR